MMLSSVCGPPPLTHCAPIFHFAARLTCTVEDEVPAAFDSKNHVLDGVANGGRNRGNVPLT
jgi:hypothetical protein